MSSAPPGARAPNRDRALQKYRIEAASHDADVTAGGPALEAIRRRAVERLEMRSRGVVLDVGCGSGLSFPLLVEAVGADGWVIGVEQSPEMIALARARVARNGWPNVMLVNAAAVEADLSRKADGALFHFTHDIMRDPLALQNVLRHLKPGARVVAAGIKWARWWDVPVNLRVWRLASRYTTTFEGLEEPWSHLQRLTTNLRWEPLMRGGGYLAWSTAPGADRK